MTTTTPGPATALAAQTPTTRPPVGEDAGAWGGKGSGSYTKQLRPGLNTLSSPGGKLTPKRIEAMRQHYQLAACLLVLTLPLIDAEATVECEDPDAAEWLQRSWEMKSFDVMRSTAKALWAGYSPNTLRWEYSTELGGLVIDKIRDLAPDTCEPLTDGDGDFAGIKQRVPGGEDEVIDNPLQCLWITEGMESGNLYGRSLLRAALDPWKDALAWRIKHLLFGERFGEPVVRVRYPDGQRVANQQDINDAIAWNADPAHAGDQKPVPPAKVVTNQQTALEMGESLSNHAVLAMNSQQAVGPDGKAIGYSWDTDFLESSRDNGAVFVEALDRADRAMARALFIPDTLFANPDTGTYALGRQHRSIFDSSTEGRLADYGRQLSSWVVDRERAVNFPNAPVARLVFSGVTDTDSEKLWALAQTLVAGGRLPVDVEALATDLGIPLLVEDEGATEPAGGVATSPFSSVGLPSLTGSGIMTVAEARELLGLPVQGEGEEQPPADDVADDVEEEPTQEEQDLPADGEQDLPAEQQRSDQGAHRHSAACSHGPGSVLGLAAVGDTTALPGYAQPQADAAGGAWARELTRVERRVPFGKLEGALNDSEATAITSLIDILGISREAVLRQVAGIMGKDTAVERIAGIETIDLKVGGKVRSVWETLIRGVWTEGLVSVQAEIARVNGDVAAKVPTTLGPEARAIASVQAASSAESATARLLGSIRASVLNGVRSGVGRAGIEAIVGALYEKETRSEAAAPRLSTRTLSAQALNGGRADAVTRGGVRLRGAQYSALLDRRTCALCERLDEQVIAIESTDLARFTPPVHHNCRCVWVWITAEEEDFTPTWTGAPASLVDANGGLVIG